MFDSYFCRKFHEKKITLEMIIDKIMSSTMSRELLTILTVFEAAFAVIILAEDGCIFAIIWGGIAVILSYVIASILLYITPKITVAVCPLTKNARTEETDQLN